LNQSTTNIPIECRTASIVSDDALILPHPANPRGWDFRERHADEALVFFLAGANESYVFALTREGFEWRTISLGEKAMAAKVAAFRRGLDVDELTKSASMVKAELFDVAAAHELYLALFGPVEALIKDKLQLLIVPSGPLTSLPLHLLVTDKPAIAVPQMQIKDMAAYRDAAWLVRRHAVTVLPSVASLKALRVRWTASMSR
jgi:hypothetical protein